ncbi:MAG: hypothetical protein QM726_13700 [Chitinophagaceae bacterium]
MNKKKLLYIALTVFVFTAAYLFYVKIDRDNSIKTYLPQPRIGDIYKMQTETSEEGVIIYYLKVKDVGAQSIYFYQSKTAMIAASDIFLKNFDTTNTQVYSRKELEEIAAGKWMNKASHNTKLIEIERK